MAALAGAIMYHEFGHYWSWVCVDYLRASYQGVGPFSYWPSKLEDDADFIAGILSAKAGSSIQDATLMIDVMAYYTLYRQGLVQSFAQIEDAYTQYMQSTQNYSSLATRKQIIAHGFDAWAMYGSQ